MSLTGKTRIRLEQSHKQCRTNAFVANIGNHQAYLRTVEDEGIVEITRHLTSRCKSAADPILKFEAIDQAENLSAFADLFQLITRDHCFEFALCRITFSMGWAAWDAKIVGICKSSAVWSIGSHC